MCILWKGCGDCIAMEFGMGTPIPSSWVLELSCDLIRRLQDTNSPLEMVHVEAATRSPQKGLAQIELSYGDSKEVLESE